MIHSDIQNQLQFLIKTSAPPLIEVADHATSTPQWAPGQRLPAHVLANLPNGRFEVRVGGQILDLNLPRNTQAGDNVELVFVTDKPRLTFALSRDLAGLVPSKAPVSLSEAARFIGSLVQKSAGDAQSQTAQALRSSPVLSGPPQSVPELAQSLRQAVTQSGLFYESHQAQWVRGERNVAALLQEPQGQLSPLLAQGKAANPAAADARQPVQAVAGHAASNPAAPANARLEAVEPRPAGTSTALQNPAGADPVHPQATPLVQQQLHALDSRQVIWHGQVWPGQEMQWEIDENDYRKMDGESEVESEAWNTRLRLDLPAIGGIDARIAFTDGAVRLDISAAKTASARLMRDRQGQLAEAFERSGLRVAGLMIQYEPDQ